MELKISDRMGEFAMEGDPASPSFDVLLNRETARREGDFSGTVRYCRTHLERETEDGPMPILCYTDDLDRPHPRIFVYASIYGKRVRDAIRIRSHFVLRSGGILTIGDLVSKTPSELLDLKNFGPRSLAEVEKALAGVGLALRPETK